MLRNPDKRFFLSGQLKDIMGGRLVALPSALGSFALPAPTAWWDSTITGSFSMSGTDVTSWADQSGNGYTVSKVNGEFYSSYPQRSSGRTLHGVQVPESSANSTLRTTGLVFNDLTFTVFAVVVIDANGSTIITGRSNPSPRLGQGAMQEGGTDGNIMFSTSWNGPVYCQLAGPSLGTPMIIAARLNTNAVYLRVRTASSDTNTSASITTPTYSAYDTHIFGGYDTHQYMDGAIAEIIYYNSVLDDVTTDGVVAQYLSPKWGI